MKLAGRVAVITGGGSGIGKATAELFAREGARLLLVDADAEGLGEVIAQLEGSGAEVMGRVADVRDAAEAEQGVDAVVAAWSRIDILVTCSAISLGGTVVTTDEATWDRVFAVNVKGCYNWAHSILPVMIAQRSGSIVLVGSQLVQSNLGGNASYVASKGAIGALAKTMAVDHAADGIRVNALMPGVIDTPMSRRSLARAEDSEAARKRWMQRHPLGRFGEPEEIARAALFLASDDSSFTTGSWLFADGGWTAN